MLDLCLLQENVTRYSSTQYSQGGQRKAEKTGGDGENPNVRRWRQRCAIKPASKKQTEEGRT
jgi:hypothetical protein